MVPVTFCATIRAKANPLVKAPCVCVSPTVLIWFSWEALALVLVASCVGIASSRHRHAGRGRRWRIDWGGHDIAGEFIQEVF